jgi:hypothetical protein
MLGVLYMYSTGGSFGRTAEALGSIKGVAGLVLLAQRARQKVEPLRALLLLSGRGLLGGGL